MGRIGLITLFVGVFLSPLFSGASVLDQPFFEGVLGRTAYSIPATYIQSTSVDNPLRFALPAELDIAESLTSLEGVVVGVLDQTALAMIDDSKKFISASRIRLYGAAGLAWGDITAVGGAVYSDVSGAIGETKGAWRALPGELDTGLHLVAHSLRIIVSRATNSFTGYVRDIANATYSNVQTMALFANVYLSSIKVSQLDPIEVPLVPDAPQEIETVFVERSESQQNFTCSRNGGFARYAWCLMHTGRAI